MLQWPIILISTILGEAVEYNIEEMRDVRFCLLQINFVIRNKHTCINN